MCGNDQIGEAFSDWLAGEILPKYMAHFHSNLTVKEMRLGYVNVEPTCSDPGYWSDHPRTPLRVGAIFLTNPLARRQMGCKESVSHQHCSAQLAEDKVSPLPTKTI